MMMTCLWFAGLGHGRQQKISWWKVVLVGACYVLHPCSGAGQWVLTAIHPDPTPPLGAPDAEFIALTALGAEDDTCVTSDGWTLDWNSSPRLCIGGCWPIGTTLVAHRAADSTDFVFGGAVAMPMATWPALVNGGGTVLLRNPSGEVMDAMPYSSESLGGGGRPVLRSDTEHCGAEANQHLWEPEMNPYCAPQPSMVQHPQTLFSAFEDARVSERLVARGAGKLDWYLGMTVDPSAMWTAQATVGGVPASVQWYSDSVVRIQWDDRPMGMGDPMDEGFPISIGPLSRCFNRNESDQLTAIYRAIRSTGEVSVVGALADPVATDLQMPLESIAVLNRSDHAIGLGSWSFGGGFLRRQTVLPQDSLVWLSSINFEDWPGMANGGGAMDLTLPQGSAGAGLAWSPCDHDAPGFSGSGLPLVRSGVPGSGWHTAGGQTSGAQEPLDIKGFGCRLSPWAGQHRIELFLNRYLAQLGSVSWKVEGHPEQAYWEAIPGRPEGVSLWWEEMGNELNSDQGVSVSFEHEGTEVSRVVVQCPTALSGDEDPCLRIIELLWNASENGDEFAEVQNCGTAPIEVSGLQATTEAVPLPSDWFTWVSNDVSLVLAPGEVAAFGRCPKWMGAGLPQKGPARWSAEQWGTLNDAGGSLKIRLPSSVSEVLDEVQWGPELKGPWWWTEDGWAWERTGAQSGDWSPAAGRGSPGAPPEQTPSVDCGEVVVQSPATLGGLPALKWALPMAGGTIVLNMIGWPSGGLLGRTVLEDVLPGGQWSWEGRVEGGRNPPPGNMLWDLKWWTGHCRGRGRFVVKVPGHG